MNVHKRRTLCLMALRLTDCSFQANLLAKRIDQIEDRDAKSSEYMRNRTRVPRMVFASSKSPWGCKKRNGENRRHLETLGGSDSVVRGCSV